MTSNDTTVNSGNQDQLVLRDLQSLLRQTISKDVIVVDFTMTSLLPLGENYGSTMMKVDAVIKRTQNSPEEKLPLVAKMIPVGEFVKNMMDITVSFGKEIFFFEKLIPAYRQLEKEAGVKDEHLFNVLPKFYGGRLTRNDERPDVGDEDSVLLMENLKIRGYYTANRREGMDFEHAKLAVSELARFHALGMALKIKNPEFFEEARKSLDVLPFKLQDMNDVVEHTMNTICKDPRIIKYEDRIKASMKHGWDAFINIECAEPWISITHGDFWVNNMMYHKENGKVDDIKFVDFQLARVCSPLHDLPYFLCGSVSINVIDAHFNDLLDIYYNHFVENLKRLGCDASPFSRQSFDKQLEKEGQNELFHCLIAVKFFTMDAIDQEELNNMKESLMLSEGNNLFLERSWKIVSKFAEMGWI